MLISEYRDLGSVVLPVWKGRQKYMHSFDTRAPVAAEGIEDYQPIALELCRRAGHSGVVHMTVDEKIIPAGMSQRRPGAHVDGRFIPAQAGSKKNPPGERKKDGTLWPPVGSWAHRNMYPDYYSPQIGGGWSHGGGGGGWLHFCNHLPVARMAVIVAASVPGCAVYPGTFDTEPQNDGDLEHIREQLGDGVVLPACNGFLLSPDCVHESMTFDRPTKRTFLRIALEPSA